MLALSGDGDVTERLLVPQVFERSNHIGLEIIPAETELLVTLISRHLENYKGNSYFEHEKADVVKITEKLYNIRYFILTEKNPFW